MLTARAFVLAVATALTVCAPARASESPLVFMGDEEPAMKKAFAKARAGLEAFLTLAAAKPADFSHFSVKVGIREGKETEYFWIIDFIQDGNSLSGKIGNTPQMVKRVKLNERHDFNREEIVDWMYIDRPKRKMVGNFTYCALLTKEPPAQATAARRRFNLDCD